MKCRFPIQLKIGDGYVYVPCGKCAWCLKNFRDQWVFRMRMESRQWKFTDFLTFTYRDADLPFNVDEENGTMTPSVRRDHVVDFHKMLWNKGYNFKFFVTSEYGPKTLRPHYHGIYWMDQRIDLESLWLYGDNNVQLPAKTSSFKYVLKYVLKGSNVPEGGDPNFRCMSRKPGIGKEFDYKGGHYILDENGIKLSVPHYYQRNYLASLEKKCKPLVESIKQQKLDYLYSIDRHFDLRKKYEESIPADIRGEPGNDFESWLYALYGKDFRKQVKINSKEK